MSAYERQASFQRHQTWRIRVFLCGLIAGWLLAVCVYS